MTGPHRPPGAWTGTFLWRLCAVLALLAVAATPAAASATSTVQMFSEAGDYIGGGAPRFFYPGNGSITISGNAGSFAVSVSGGSMGTDNFLMTIAAPPGENLHTGLYTGAQRAPFRQFGHPGLDINGDGRGCNEVGGRFDVKDFHVGVNGTPDRLWITFEQHCENGLPALFGEIRVGEPDGSNTLLVIPQSIWWPDVAMKATGSTVPVTLISIGAGAVSIATVAVDGLQAADFPVQVDGCAGHALQPGAACQVFLKFTPKIAGPHVARFVATDGAAQTYVVSLDGYGTPGVTTLVMHSDPGDYVGAGLDYKYTPGNAQITISGNFGVIHGRINGKNGDWWNLDFAAKPGDILKKGKYKNATRYPFNGSSPGLSVSGNGRGCNTLTGDFKVTNISVGVDNTVQAFAVNFTQHCEGSAPALHGTLKFQVPKGDTTPPAQVSSLVVTRGQNSADVSWINPADPDFAFTLVRFLPGTTAPGAPDSGFLAFAGAGASVSIPGVPGAQSLAVAVYTVDTQGNVGPPVTSVTP